jgi:DNA modification methylase
MTTVKKKENQNIRLFDEKSVLKLKGSQWQKLSPFEQDKIIEICVRYWRKRGFPYYQLADSDIIEEYTRLANVSYDRILLGSEIRMSMVGVKVANYFHPHMWAVKVNGRHSPLESFDDERTLPRIIRRALNIFSDRYSVNESNMRRMLRSYSHTAAVSNFRPTAAKAIYEKYSKDGDRVLDFSAGYGGRLLGCMPLDRLYIGIDPCSKQVRGLHKMISNLKALVEIKAETRIHHACAEDFLPTIRPSSISLIFSSPPYFNHERYSNEPSQSFVRYPTYHEWLNFFLKRIISESRRILKPGGYLALNVADINGFRLAEDALHIARDYFTLSETLMLGIGHLPYLRRRTNTVCKYEPIYIMKKAHLG